MAGQEPGTTHPSARWWESSVTYQVYLRSFCDGDGDGNGDIDGLRANLDHIGDLGVDAIWISPWFRSPMVDNGYDVMDYRDVDPMFGDLRSAGDLIGAAHRAGLKVILDLVANHTSLQHPWFQAALRSAPGSGDRDRYHFRDGRGPDGQLPPNDWISAFGGSAWTRTTSPGGAGQWYLHLFAPEQPDLNWTNPQVRAEFASILRFWFDLGVDGMRVDAASAFAKAAGLPDFGFAPGDRFEPENWATSPLWDVDGVHDVHRMFRAVADSYAEPRLLVGEVATNSRARFGAYLRGDELHQAFNLELSKARWDAADLATVIDRALATMAQTGSPPAWVLSSHDEPRHVSRFTPGAGSGGAAARGAGAQFRAGGEDAVGQHRARAALLLMLALPGSAFLFQGEELGLPDVQLPDALIRDPIFRLSGGRVRGRDACRVPLPWSGQEPPYGFSTNAATWLPQPPGWAGLCAHHQRGRPGSMLEFYRRALRVRRAHLSGRQFAWRPAPAGVLRFDRDRGVTCVLNLGGRPIPIHQPVLLASQPLIDGALPPDAAAWLTGDPADAVLVAAAQTPARHVSDLQVPDQHGPDLHVPAQPPYSPVP